MKKRKKGEPLEEYIDRLVNANQHRIRIHSDYIDPEGNVIVRPILMFGRDPNDDYRIARMDTLGRLDVVGVCPEHQPMAELDQASPGDGTTYDVLPVDELVRLLGFSARCTWTVQPTPLECFVTIDGNTLTFKKSNPVSNTWYYGNLVYSAAENNLPMGTGQFQWAHVLEGRSVQLESEISGGTVSRLQTRAYWAKW